jgi:hypothetical protein
VPQIVQSVPDTGAPVVNLEALSWQRRSHHSTTPVASVLRMVKVVAARMDAMPLADWVGNELGGYPAGVAVPDYRGPFRTEVLSERTGPFSSIARNIPLAPLWVPQDMLDLGGFEITFHESVSELERLVKLDTLAYRWPADIVAFLNGRPW